MSASTGNKKRIPEVLPAVMPPSIPASVGQALERLVEAKIAELRAREDGMLLEPWFRSRKEAQELRRLQTVPERRKWSLFYERHGCLRCKNKRLIHAGNGLCQNCRAWVQQKLTAIVKELMAEKTGAPHYAGCNLLPG